MKKSFVAQLIIGGLTVFAVVFALLVIGSILDVAGSRDDWMREAANRQTETTLLASQIAELKSRVEAAASSTPQDEAGLLKKLSQDWRKDPELAPYADRAKAEFATCPIAVPAIDPNNAGLIPENSVELLAFPTHRCDAVLRAYIGCTEASSDGAYCETASWKVRVIIEDTAGSRYAYVLADLTYEHGASSGGLSVPYAFTKDDRNVILDTWMGSPGAGGGSNDYGYGVMSRQPQVQDLVPRESHFYGALAKVVYLANSDKLPSYSQPGPVSNFGAIRVKDLVTMKDRLVLEESDTTYDLVFVDEKMETLTIQSTKHQFTADCPRQEDALICTKKTVKERTIPLP